MSVSFDELHEEIAGIIEDFASRQEPLGSDFSKAIFENIEDLYVGTTDRELRCRVEVLESKVSQRSTEIIETSFENEYLKRLLKEAAILAEIASDWNLYEVEIQHEMVSTLHLASKFRNASNSTQQEGSLHASSD